MTDEQSQPFSKPILVSDGSASGTCLVEAFSGEDLAKRLPLTALGWAVSAGGIPTIRLELAGVDTEVELHADLVDVIIPGLGPKSVSAIEFADGKRLMFRPRPDPTDTPTTDAAHGLMLDRRCA